MVLTENEIKEKLYNFTKKCNKPFTITEFLDELKIADNNDLMYLCIDSLLFEQWAYIYKPHKNSLKQLWISQHAFFNGKHFRIQANKSELDENIFIIGTRLWPFCTVNVASSSISLSYKGNPVPLIKINITPEESMIYYDLAGDNFSAQIICADDETNSKIFLGLSEGITGDLTVSAFDFSEIYQSLDVKKGDRLELRVEDWQKAQFELVAKAPHVSQVNAEQWMQTLYLALHQGIKIFSTAISVEDLLGFAFSLASNELFSTNQVSIDEFIAQHKSFHIIDFGLETRLWPIDMEIPHEDLWIFSSRMPNTELEVFFYEKNIPVNEVIIQMYMLNFLSKQRFKQASIPEINDFITSLAEQLLAPWIDEDRDTFAYLRAELFERFVAVKDSYNVFSDTVQRDVRATVIPLYQKLQKMLSFLHKNKIKTRALSADLGVQINQIVEKILGFIEYTILNPYLEYNTYFETLILSAENFSDMIEDINIQMINEHKKLQYEKITRKTKRRKLDERDINGNKPFHSINFD